MPAGRPSELTRTIIADAARLLPHAMYLETVADSIGVHRTTFRRWVKAGGREQRRREMGKPPRPKYDLHCEFCIAIKKALAGAEADYLSEIQAAGTESWQALAWLLERRHPQRWGSQRAEVRALQKRIGELEKQLGGAVGTPEPSPVASGTSPDADDDTVI